MQFLKSVNYLLLLFAAQLAVTSAQPVAQAEDGNGCRTSANGEVLRKDFPLVL